MKVRDIAKIIDKQIPLKLAQDWDNVGLLVGDAEKNVERILMTIDVTQAVVEDAVKQNAQLILSYHPVIWDGLKKVTSNSADGKIVYELLRNNIAVFSVHTAVDVLAGGVNDGLAEMVGIVDGKPIGDYVTGPSGENYKLVIFVPEDSLEKVADAVFKAGAGAIGNYSHCGFQTPGEGSFLPLDGATPAIGKRGRLEKVAEIRFECIASANVIGDCIRAMREAHPYETPAFDVFKLHGGEEFGLGRIGKLEKAVSLEEIIAKVKKVTKAKAVGIVGPRKRKVKKAAVCAGSCGSIVNKVIADGADLYLTGELKHHQALAAQEAGLTCLCLSHTVSERFILKKLAAGLKPQLPKVDIRISKKDDDPFVWKEI